MSQKRNILGSITLIVCIFILLYWMFFIRTNKFYSSATVWLGFALIVIGIIYSMFYMHKHQNKRQEYSYFLSIINYNKLLKINNTIFLSLILLVIFIFSMLTYKHSEDFIRTSLISLIIVLGALLVQYSNGLLKFLNKDKSKIHNKKKNK